MRNRSDLPELAKLAAQEKLSIYIETMDVDSDESVTQAFAAILAQGPLPRLHGDQLLRRHPLHRFHGDSTAIPRHPDPL